MDIANLAEYEYLFLESLTGKYNFGRQIKPSDNLQVIQDFSDHGCIINSEHRVKITEQGEIVYKHNKNFRLLLHGRFPERLRATFSEVFELF